MREVLTGEWGSERIVSRERVRVGDELPGFIAEQGDEVLGLVIYDIRGNECELVSLNSARENIGIGSALLATVANAAREAGCRRIWVITTNDNLRALRFYQKRGMRLAALYPNAIQESRRIKPEIPMVGRDGIPLRDELELEIILQ